MRSAEDAPKRLPPLVGLEPYELPSSESSPASRRRANSSEHGDVDAFVRQLCRRDFFGQLLAANPHMQWKDLHARGNSWRDDDQALAA
jgi:deoxyribodipyrimidine photolyase